MEIRFAQEKDAEDIRRIYEPYVVNTAITFDYDVPDTAEFRRRINTTLENYPYLVALEHGQVIAYAYAGHFRPRKAYEHGAELSIYVDSAYAGQGVGRALYKELEKYLAKQNVFVLYACITASEDNNDEHITDTSIRFHEALGYRLCGKFFHCGYKFGKWYSMIWMEKEIVERPSAPAPFVPFSLLFHE